MQKNSTEATVSEMPRCSFCHQMAEYDGKTNQGPWAYMCDTHFKILGCGLGLGKGQKLVVTTGGVTPNDWGT